ncbi:hypothetical protein E2C01_058386 [Portunus trituberculatus]|uniref:Uncharacterized protein n=1 Tax=Portunus trituberculatus TaxID=210409 RepID=A0A5B7H5Z3_PORTR|nr:hypothetical protein [Portunus trituberculatus]
MFLARCQKSRGGGGFRKILTYSINEGVFGKLKNSLGMILDRISPPLCAQHTEMGL